MDDDDHGDDVEEYDDGMTVVVENGPLHERQQRQFHQEAGFASAGDRQMCQGATQQS